MLSLRLLSVLLVAVVIAGCSDKAEFSVIREQHATEDQAVGVSAEVRTIQHDFGMVRPGQKLTHGFEIKNTFDYPLQILNVDVPCSCTVVRNTSSVVPAGAVLTLPVELTASGRIGDVTKSVTVSFREPRTPVVRCTLLARVRPVIQATPEQIEIKDGGVSATPLIRVASYAPNKDLRLSADVSKCRFDCVIKVVPSVAVPGCDQAWQLSLTPSDRFERDSSTATVMEAIRIDATDAEGLVDSISIRLAISPPRMVQCDKSLVNFLEVRRGSSSRQSIKIDLAEGIASDGLECAFEGLSPNTGDSSPWLAKLENDGSLKGIIEFDAGVRSVSPGLYKAVLVLEQATH